MGEGKAYVADGELAGVRRAVAGVLPEMRGDATEAPGDGTTAGRLGLTR